MQMIQKKIYIGADHAGFELKEKIKKWWEKEGIPYIDIGAHEFNPEDDYPDFAEIVAKKVAQTESLGILICGSAQGMCIAANKIKGARAVIPSSLKEVRLTRQHNNANIICLSGWFNNFHKARKMIKCFLTTSFSAEPKHVRRVKKIKKLELIS